MNLSENIARFRREAGLSQEGLAERLEVSRQAVSKWESGQARPELDKLTAMARLFGVSLDELAGLAAEGTADGGTQAAAHSPRENAGEEAPPPPPPQSPEEAHAPPAARRGWLRRGLALLAAFAVGFGAAVVWDTRRTEPQNPYSGPAVDTSDSPDFAAGDEMAALRLAVFDFAALHRLDYVPFFAQGEAPGEAQEYLFYAFAIRLEEWGEDKGRMSTAYVEEVVRSHFERRNLSHGPLHKAWSLEGDTYVAYPDAIRELPLCLMREIRFFEQDGRALCELTVDFCGQEGLIPDEAERADIRRRIAAGDDRLLTLLSRERFLLTRSETGEVVFLAHEAVPVENDAA